MTNNSWKASFRRVLNMLPPAVAHHIVGLYRSTAYEARVRASPPRERATPAEAYGIRRGYRHRPNNAFFDDTPNRDEYQREVYEAAAAYAAQSGARRIIDVGCGSAFKLVQYFPDTETIGLDLEPTVSWLRSTYPGRTWLESDFSAPPPSAEVVICADVVEHIPDPDALMGYLHSMNARRWFVSTPDRTMVYGWNHKGPPNNAAHCREWTQAEFRNYVSKWFKVVDQRITNVNQRTQMVVLER